MPIRETRPLLRFHTTALFPSSWSLGSSRPLPSATGPTSRRLFSSSAPSRVMQRSGWRLRRNQTSWISRIGKPCKCFLKSYDSIVTSFEHFEQGFIPANGRACDWIQYQFWTSTMARTWRTAKTLQSPESQLMWMCKTQTSPRNSESTQFRCCCSRCKWAFTRLDFWNLYAWKSPRKNMTVCWISSRLHWKLRAGEPARSLTSSAKKLTARTTKPLRLSKSRMKSTTRSMHSTPPKARGCLLDSQEGTDSGGWINPDMDAHLLHWMPSRRNSSPVGSATRRAISLGTAMLGRTESLTTRMQDRQQQS